MASSTVTNASFEPARRDGTRGAQTERRGGSARYARARLLAIDWHTFSGGVRAPPHKGALVVIHLAKYWEAPFLASAIERQRILANRCGPRYRSLRVMLSSIERVRKAGLFFCFVFLFLLA